MPDRRTTLYGVVTFGDRVGVVPFVDETHIVLVRQYRYVFGENFRWEIPTGGVKEDEPLEEAARRELAEEAGYRAGRLSHMSSYYTSKSICDETAHIYLGQSLTASHEPPDDTEFLQRRVVPFNQALRMTLEGEIMDIMSVIWIMLAARRLGL